jgi:arylformamidase
MTMVSLEVGHFPGNRYHQTVWEKSGPRASRLRGLPMALIDLSHTIEPLMPVFPGTFPPALTAACTLADHGFRELSLSMVSHTGTHVDAPAHLLEHGRTLDQYPLESFYGTARVIDVSKSAGGVIELSALAGLSQPIQDVDFVLLRTGWSTLWGQRAYFGSFPTLSEDAAQFLVERRIKAVGVDAISVDPIDSRSLPIHRTLLGAGILILENLTNLDLLPTNEFTLSFLPLPVQNADGFSVRAVAIV